MQGYDEFEVTDIGLLEISGLNTNGNRVSIPTWKFWESQLQNSNRSSFTKVRLYVRIDYETNSKLINKIGCEILEWIQERCVTFDPSSFAFWEVADYLNDKEFGWSQMIDLRSRTICLQVVMQKIIQADWQPVRDGQTAFIKTVKEIFTKHHVTFSGVLGKRTTVKRAQAAEKEEHSD